MLAIALLLGLFVVTGAVTAGSASAAQTIFSYSDSSISNPRGIVLGPDGALWFTNLSGNSIGRIDPITHAIASYSDASVIGPIKITVGPDSALWFTNYDGNSIGRIDPTTHVITSYSDATVQNPQGIRTGPDGALWFTNFGGNSIGRIDPTTDTITNYSAPTIASPVGIVLGPDNALWFANFGNNSIGRIDPSTHVITAYNDPTIDSPRLLTVGPDQALWFTNINGNSIGRIDPTTHVITAYADPSINGPSNITVGPDGALWFTNNGNSSPGNSIGRIDPTTHVITSYPDPSIAAPVGIVTGPDGALWFSNSGANTIGRLVPDGELGGTIIQSITVERPNGGLVLTQVCGAHGATTSGTAPTYGGAQPGNGGAVPGQADPLAGQYPYPVDANGVPNPNYPTRCGVDLGTAALISSGPSKGQFFSASGSLNQITVVDSRDTDPGFTVNGQMGAFGGPGGRAFSGNQMGWTPVLTLETPSFTDGSGTTYRQNATAGPAVAPNTAGTQGLAAGAVLGDTSAGSGLGIVRLDANLTLWIPVFARAGAYTGTLTITAI